MNINEFEPKRLNRFRVEFPKDFNLESVTVESADKPKWVNQKWCDLNISLVDIINPSTSQAIYRNIINKYIDDVNYNFDYNIFALDPVGNVVEEWCVTVKSLDIDFGVFDHHKDNYSVINFYITPSCCILKY